MTLTLTLTVKLSVDKHYVARRIVRFLRFFRCATIFSVLLDRSRPSFGLQSGASLSYHTCSGFSSTSQILTAQLHSQHVPLHHHCYHALGLIVYFPATTSGHFADTHCLTNYEPNFANSQNVPAWSEVQTTMVRKLVMDRIHQSFPGEVHACKRSQLSEDIGRATCLLTEANALNKHAPRATQEYEQAIRD